MKKCFSKNNCGMDKSLPNNGGTDKCVPYKMRITLLIFLLLATFSLFAQGVTAARPSNYTDSDAGTASNPYLIENLANLRWLSERPADWYVDQDTYIHVLQTADIDASETSTWNGGAGFTPIAQTATLQNFLGIYDGGGFKIIDLTIDKSGSGVGLFFLIYGLSVIKNVTLENVDFTGIDYVGGIIAQLRASNRIENCHTSGKINGNDFIGGIAGNATSYATIENCTSETEIDARNNIGGIAGKIESNSTIKNCHYTGDNIDGGNFVGGIAGYLDTASLIENCSTTGEIYGTNYVGGIAGGIYESTIKDSHSEMIIKGSYRIGGINGQMENSTISNCYFVGEFNITGNITGGIAGYAIDGSTIENCYSTPNIINNGDVSNFGGIVGYMQGDVAEPCFITNCYSEGNITASQCVGGIGGTTQTYVTISNCYSLGDIKATSSASAAQCGGISGRISNNVTIKDSYSLGSVTGYSRTGGIAGEVNADSKIENCYSEGDVEGTGNYNGGIAGGFANNSIIINCYSTGNISGNGDYTGGIVGNIGDNSTIEDCFSTGIINGTTAVGGIAGHNSASSILRSYSSGEINGTGAVGGITGTIMADGSTLKDCYTLALVNGNSSVGGITGSMGGGSPIIENCYVVGAINGNESVGVIYGVRNTGSIINCFWDIETIGITTDPSNFGLSTYQMKQTSNFTSVGWDFTTIWTQDNDRNFGYPYLRSLSDVLISNRPQNVVATGLPVSVRLTWNAPLVGSSGVLESYRIYRRLDSDTSWTLRHTTVNPSTFTWTDTGLTGGASYFYYVTAVYPPPLPPPTHTSWGGQFESAPFPIVGVVPLPNIINPPVNLTAVPGNLEVYLSWDVPLPGSTATLEGYKIYRDGTELPIGVITTTDYTDTGLVSGLVYKYHVTAIYDITPSESEISNTVFISLFSGGTTRPERPTNYDDLDAGTSLNPYLIADLGNLRWLSEWSFDWWIDENTPIYFQQTNDIDAEESVEWNNDNGFRPIGHNVGGIDYFTGVYDGDWYKIYNLYINRNNGLYSGLFSYLTNNSTISGLSLIDLDVTGLYYTGGLAGMVTNNSLIENCYTSGNINGTQRTGGIVGNAGNNSVITNCSSSATVHGASHYTAGIVGYMLDGASISLCYTTGVISGDGNYTGGIVGWGQNANISNCYSFGDINGRYIQGGIAGQLNDFSTINTCYFAGTLGGAQFTGGIAGMISRSTMENCLWDKEVSGVLTAVFQATPATNIGLSSYEMKNDVNYLSRGWDFASIWEQDQDLNFGYPFLQSLPEVPITPAPIHFSAMAFENAVTLQWETPPPTNTSHLNNYKIYQYNAEDLEWILVYQTPSASTLIFTDDEVIGGNEYNYFVTAVYSPLRSSGNISGESAPSNEVTITPIPSPAAFMISPEYYDFGNIIVATISDCQEFTITNTGGTPLTIEDIVGNAFIRSASGNTINVPSVGNAFIRSASGNRNDTSDFIITDLPTLPMTLPPNESINFNVTFTPQTPGIKTDEIIITHNADESPFIVEVSGLGLDLPVFTITPESHDFGTHLVATISDCQIFEITNTGGSPLSIIEISDFQSDDFVIGYSITERINAFPTELGPDESVSFIVSFTPQTTGIKSDQIIITHSAAESPFIVELSGTALDLPIFTITPESHDFGTHLLATISDCQIFTITNNGGTPLTIEDISPSVGNAFIRSASGNMAGSTPNRFATGNRNETPDFIINDIPTLPMILNPNESTTFTVAFNPQTAGIKTEQIIITHSADDVPFIVGVNGIGLDLPIFTITPESHDFGTHLVATISDCQEFTITNTGGSSLIISDITAFETDDFEAERINAFPTELGPDESVSFTVTFTPQTNGIKTDQIIITHSADDMPFIVEVTGMAIDLPVFTIDPESHDFNNVFVGTISDCQIFTITNNGGSPLIISDISDFETEDFISERINAFPTELGQDQSVSFTVTFAPLTEGRKSDQISITHSASETPFIVHVYGSAREPILKPPINVFVSARNSKVDIGWEPPEEPGDGRLIGYKIYRDGDEYAEVDCFVPRNNENESAEVDSASFLAAKGSPRYDENVYEDYDVVNGTEYTYYITAVYEDPAGESESSNIVTVTLEAVDNKDEVLPLKTELVGNYPNPFNPETTIKFTLKHESNLRVDIYNIKGQKVVTLLDTHLNAGEHTVTWNGKDDNGREVVSGVYFYRMQTDEYVSIKKMMMMK